MDSSQRWPNPAPQEVFNMRSVSEPCPGSAPWLACERQDSGGGHSTAWARKPGGELKLRPSRPTAWMQKYPTGSVRSACKPGPLTRPIAASAAGHRLRRLSSHWAMEPQRRQPPLAPSATAASLTWFLSHLTPPPLGVGLYQPGSGVPRVQREWKRPRRGTPIPRFPS